MDPQALALFPVWYAAFLLSLTCHEAAHAIAAHRGGDDTAYLAGQVSLNPWPHVRREPLGTILVPILTYFMGRGMMGWASAPYDPSWGIRYPRRAALMSAAGPAANLLLVVIAFGILKAGLATGLFAHVPSDSVPIDHLVAAAPNAPAIVDALGRFLSIMMSLNVILGVFNLIPVPPLDGIGVAAGFLPPLREAYGRMRGIPAVSLLGVVVAWRLSPYVVNPVLTATVHALLA